MNNHPISPRGASPSFAMHPPPLPAFLRHQNPTPHTPSFAHSPPSLHLQLSPPKPTSDYLLHLVPQPQPSRNFSFHAHPPLPHPEFIHSPPFPQEQRQFLERPSGQQVENRELRSSTEKHEFQHVMSNPQAFSQVVRSKGFSECSPRFNSHIQGREMAVSEYQQPRSPREVANIEQVRRVSQYKEVSDKKSHRSSSQHNIHITIESSIEGETPPTITISPNSKAKHADTHLPPKGAHFNGVVHRAENFVPQIAVLPRPASITQTIITHQPPVHQPVILNQPPTIISHHHPVFIHPPHPTPPMPLPLQSETKEAHQQQNTLPSYSQLPHNQIINDTLLRDRISSLSIGEMKQKKHSIQTMARQEYYNQLAEREDESEADNACENRTTGFSAYISDQRMMMHNTRRLIDEIFENETHRALLQMRVLEATSREKVIKKSGSRHIKKTAL